MGDKQMAHVVDEVQHSGSQLDGEQNTHVAEE